MPSLRGAPSFGSASGRGAGFRPSTVSQDVNLELDTVLSSCSCGSKIGTQNGTLASGEVD